MTDPVIRFLKIHPDARIPKPETPGAAGADLSAVMPDNVAELMLAPGERLLVPTGLRVAVPEGHEIQVRPRSGLALRHGVTVLNAPGTVDADFRGELKVLLCNHGAETFTIRTGDRIAQAILAPVVRFLAECVEDLDETERGQGGFGSTGMGHTP